MIRSCKIGGMDIIKLVEDIQGLKTKEDSRDLETLYITINHHDDEDRLNLFNDFLFKNNDEAFTFELGNCDKYGNFTYRFLGNIKFKELELIKVKNHLNSNVEPTHYLMKFEYNEMLMTNKTIIKKESL